jgi:hypothetical protein
MYLLPSSNRFYFLLLILSLMYGCKKISSLTNNPSNPTDSSSSGTDQYTDENLNIGPPAITAIGIPVGNLVTKTIGPAGGSITSDDAKIDLIIPSGALSASTGISIQSISNQCPGSIGLAYRLLPIGTKFSVPASFVFHYTDLDVNGTDPLLLYNVFQDSLNEWEVNTEDRSIDTSAKTVSFKISHFTDDAVEPATQVDVSVGTITSLPVPGGNLTASKYEFKKNQTGTLELRRWIFDKRKNLIPTNPHKYTQASNWRVNGAPGGNSNDGTITGSGPTVTYTAPSVIYQIRYVDVSVDLPYSQTYPGKANEILIVIKYYTFHCSLRLLIEDLTFDVHIYVRVLGLSDMFDKTDLYNDSANMVVNYKDGNIDIPDANIVNYHPTETPQSRGDEVNGPAYIWVPDLTGWINIQSASGFAAPLPTGLTEALITVVSSGTVNPQFTIVPGGGSASYNFGGTKSSPWPPNLIIVVRDSFQLWSITADGTLGYTVTPRH